MLTLMLFPTSSGATWFDAGNPVCVEAGDQHDPAIVSDGAGGAIIAFSDQREMTAYTDLYAQRIDLDGNILWGVGGVPICTVSSDQERPMVVSDGDGGAIILWRDMRSETGWAQIYVQRVDPDGNRLWTAGGVLLSGMVFLEEDPGFISDGAGGAFVCWTEARPTTDFDVFAQRLGPGGEKLWGPDGIIVCGAEDAQYYPSLVSDGAGGVYAAWGDRRPGSYYAMLYAQRVDGGGNPLWETDGVLVQQGGELQYFRPLALPDGSGGAVIIWRKHNITCPGGICVGYDFDISARRIGPDGTVYWGGSEGTGTVVYEDPSFIGMPVAVPDGSGGVILAFEKNWEDTVQIYAQRIDFSGNTVWTEGGVPLCARSDEMYLPSIITDGSGGAIISWSDGWDGPGLDIYAQRLSAVGVPEWGAAGIAVCAEINVQDCAVITAASPGEAMVVWRDKRNLLNFDIYCGRLTYEGSVVASLLEFSRAFITGRYAAVEWRMVDSEDDYVFSIERKRDGEELFTLLSGAPVLQSDGCFVYTDTGSIPGETYRYRVIYDAGEGRKVLFETGLLTVPEAVLVLGQNRPNPFNPSTVIEYYLPQDGEVRLEIYDVKGRHIRRLVSRHEEAGQHKVTWDGRDSCGSPVASGVYVYRLDAGKNMVSKKMILLR